jgi:ribosomal protein S18 acetylase RimI-like enzyme
MHSALTIRPARESDKAPIWRLYEDALRHHIEVIWGWDTAWQEANFDQAFMRMSTRVIDMGGRIAGYVQVDTGAEEDYLSMLILHPDARCRGLGAHLLSTIRAESRREGRGLYLRVPDQCGGAAFLRAGRVGGRRGRRRLPADAASGRRSGPDVVAIRKLQ